MSIRETKCVILVDSAIQPLNNRGLARVARKVDNTIYWRYLYLYIESLLSTPTLH